MKRPHESPECRCPGCQASDSIEEKLIEAANRVCREGGKPDWALLFEEEMRGVDRLLDRAFGIHLYRNGKP